MRCASGAAATAMRHCAPMWRSYPAHVSPDLPPGPHHRPRTFRVREPTEEPDCASGHASSRASARNAGLSMRPNPRRMSSRLDLNTRETDSRSRPSSSGWRSADTTAYDRSSISTSPSSHATSACAAFKRSSTESSPVIGGSRVCATVHPCGSTRSATPTFLDQRPESPSGLDEHANLFRPHQHEGQRSPPVRPLARGPVVPVDPRW